MLLEFKVKNFRSLRDESTLSLVASSDKSHLSTNAAQTGIKTIPHSLRVAALYGANASGKSNLVRALQLMRGIVVESANLQPNQTLNIQPFMLDLETRDQPTEFEITFLLKGVRYQYGFSLTATRIMSEWLLVYKTGKAQKWFARDYDAATDEEVYEFSTFFLGQRKLWEQATKPNSLYLSVATQFNSEQLLDVYRYISENIVIFENGTAPSFEYTVSHIQQNSSKAVVEFLSEADIGISEIDFEEKKGMELIHNFDLFTGNFNSNQREKIFVVPKFKHQNEKTSAVFEFNDESEGTRKLFSFFGPLNDIFKEGKTLVVDELDRSLHALLVRQIVRMFQDPEINVNGAQLIFTTHDTTLLDANLFRRDQIWFTEKDRSQASCLYSLTDFSARKNEAFEKGYLSGRYGAIPILRRFKVLD
jgi:uncharacterized protein